MPAITFEKIKSAENQEKQEEKLAEKLGGFYPHLLFKTWRPYYSY